MKFFTLDGWLAAQDWRSTHDPLAPSREYRAYVDSVRERLPTDFQRMLDSISLHDAELRELIVDLPAGRVVMRLDAGDLTMREARYVRLAYERAVAVTSSADSRRGLPGPHGYGDLGYDEIEVLPDGTYEHRMLFSTGIELGVRFGEFRLEVLAGAVA